MFRAFHHHRHAGAVQVHICKEDWSLIGSAYLLCESRCEVCGTDGTPCAALKRVEAYNGIGDTHRLPPPAADFEIAPTSYSPVLNSPKRIDRRAYRPAPS